MAGTCAAEPGKLQLSSSLSHIPPIFPGMPLNKPAASPLTRDEWRLVLLLSAINFVHILDFVIVMPLGDLLRHELSITPRQFGFVVSAYGICAMIAGVVAATVIDRFDRRRTMLIAFVGFLATTLYCGLAPSYEHLLLARGRTTGWRDGWQYFSVCWPLDSPFCCGQPPLPLCKRGI